jgi:hypothetical protein
VLLRKTAKDPTSLVAVESTVGLELVGKHPFTGDDVRVGRGRMRYQVLLAWRAPYSSVMAASQCGSWRAPRTDLGTGDGDVGDVTVSTCRLRRSRGPMTLPACRRVIMG